MHITRAPYQRYVFTRKEERNQKGGCEYKTKHEPRSDRNTSRKTGREERPLPNGPTDLVDSIYTLGRLSLERSVSRDNIMAEREELEEPAERREAAGRDEEAEEDEVKPVNKNKRYRRDKPWDGEHIDHWTVSLSRRSGSLSTHQFTPAICSSFSGMLNSHLICHACTHTF